jgi:DedD protein
VESRLKERLTGAAILVALIVVLVPEMFHGQRTDVATTASSGEGPPVRSYTIDLSNGPARTAPLQSTPPQLPATAEAVSEAPSAPPPPAASAAASPAGAGAAGPATPSSAPSATKATPTVSKAVPATVPAAAVSPARAGGGSWSVQLGIFAQHDNAERLMHGAQGKGFAAIVSERDAKGLYHVEVTNLSDRAAAQAMQTRLRDQGLPAAVVPPAAKH